MANVLKYLLILLLFIGIVNISYAALTDGLVSSYSGTSTNFTDEHGRIVGRTQSEINGEAEELATKIVSAFNYLQNNIV